ncbi:MAG TPA: hypothetical protein VG796_06035 [Verrucomicrobiales bacterium]|jgi:hypothetical protein|nr:hypothetical protein [Verrucomicrobiales bacterium]
MPARARKKTAPSKKAASEPTMMEKIKEFGEHVLETVTKPFRHTPARKTSRKQAGGKAPAKKAASTGKPAAKKTTPAKKAAAKKAAPAKRKSPAKKTAPAKGRR